MKCLTPQLEAHFSFLGHETWKKRKLKRSRSRWRREQWGEGREGEGRGQGLFPSTTPHHTHSPHSTRKIQEVLINKIDPLLSNSEGKFQIFIIAYICKSGWSGDYPIPNGFSGLPWEYVILILHLTYRCVTFNMMLWLFVHHCGYRLLGVYLSIKRACRNPPSTLCSV